VSLSPAHAGDRPTARRRCGRAELRQRRRRRLAGLLRFAVFLLLVFLAVWAGVRVAHAGDDGTLYTGEAYVVRTGDTLWSIADVTYGDEIDLRAAVRDIAHVNGLDGPELQPGDVLRLPYQEPH
jgi:hypothetical protein